MQLIEPVLARRLHGDAALLAPAAPAAAGEQDHERDERDSVAAMLAVAMLLALVPTPIGTGPRYHPLPAAHGPCRAAAIDRGPRVHLELFAAGRVVIVPAAIGLRGASSTLGRVTRARCRAHLWTTDPTGVVGFEPGATLGDLFARLGPSARARAAARLRGGVRVYVNGVRRKIDPRALRLRDGDELVLELGPFIPPHAAIASRRAERVKSAPAWMEQEHDHEHGGDACAEGGDRDEQLEPAALMRPAGLRASRTRRSRARARAGEHDRDDLERRRAAAAERRVRLDDGRRRVRRLGPDQSTTEPSEYVWRTANV